MNETRLFEQLAELCAIFKVNREAEVKALDDFLSFLYKSATAEYDTTKIRWDKVEGPRGFYERAGEDSLDFNLLIKDLRKHGGKLTQNGYFYWKFNDVNVVGRKPKN